MDSAGGLRPRDESGRIVKATVNGELRELADGLTVSQLLEMIGTPQSGIAVARNDRVVRRGDYGQQIIEEGDAIEIIKAVAGG